MALAAAGFFAADRAGATSATSARSRLPYPADVTDTSHCSPAVAEILRGFFTAKSEHNTAELLSYWSKTNVYYVDAGLGAVLPNRDALNGFYVSTFANVPPTALSYPLRIVGDSSSAVVEFVNTPQLFGAEVRIFGSVTFDSRGKIIRWADYWDGRSTLFPNAVGASYPTDFKDGEQDAAHQLLRVAKALQTAFAAGDAAAAAALMSFDVVHEDMAAHTFLRGQGQVQRYYTRALGHLPYGPGAAVAHVEGSRLGGGYEWTAGPAASPMRRGHTCIELDKAGKITRLTAIYDSSLLSYSAYQSLVGLAAEAPL